MVVSSASRLSRPAACLSYNFARLNYPPRGFLVAGPKKDPSVQVLLFCVFALGGGYRFFQPIDSLARRMLWVKYFKPGIVRFIALIEVVCGIGLLLPLLLTDFSASLIFYSGGLLILTMIGAVVTHAIIGDYRQIIGNICIIGMLYFITFPMG